MPGIEAAYVRNKPRRAAMPPPTAQRGYGEILRTLFATPTSSILTIGCVAIVVFALPALLRFFVFDAVWNAADGAACRAPGAGACWAFIAHKLPYFAYGSYPAHERWRVDLVFGIGAILVAWLLNRNAPGRRFGGALFLLYPPLALILLAGAPALGLSYVSSDLWGGILVTFVVAGFGILVSLPLGILLALGRRSHLPAVRLVSIAFIEFMRGVPMIAVLFMATTMLPLFLPERLSPDRLVPPLIGVALFASAYMAEVVRGGLQALPKAQSEAAEALGLRFWAIQRLVILPQALRLVIPAITNTFIGLFKDTTLVATVGIFEFLQTVNSALLDPNWAGPTITTTAYSFAAIFYFLCCFGMSRYSSGLERRLAVRRIR
jgi:general L-amino acid transport system permease protein